MRLLLASSGAALMNIKQALRYNLDGADHEQACVI